MTTGDQLSGAKAYVEASNAHDLDAVESLLAPDALYVSSNVGSYSGRSQIRAMMDVFFATYRDVSWATSNWRLTADGGAAFDIIMSGTNCQTGERLTKRGEEFIWVGENGLITLIKVATS